MSSMYQPESNNLPSTPAPSSNPQSAHSVGSFCVRVQGKAYHVDRSVLAKILYFRALFSFNGVAVANGEIVLDDTADSTEGWERILKFLYKGGYSYTGDIGAHARAYVMAERLCMDDFKGLVYCRARVMLAADSKASVYAQGAVSAGELIDVVYTIYQSTPSRAVSRDTKDTEAKDSGKQTKLEPFGARSVGPQTAVFSSPPTTSADAPSCSFDPGSAESVGYWAGPFGGFAPRSMCSTSNNWSNYPLASRASDPMTNLAMPSRDPMRQIITNFAGSRLDRLRSEPRFLDLIYDLPEFAQDLMFEVMPGPELA